ncbi:hypothetical protein BDB00DRAFT_869608 [Zychaea mexicana]|uniref:uncharacterized protein n=1 Tax=Zychaea mexicana TaxID=64656 RepID=UPI0022FEB5D7|nr:uncharacterized protein BDB00DRAFT_869608 [Zychaea mexicana]KAI9496310.1 hypothetical protein BDB00DRAFT_869608 [Zychaea mexicana]
MSGGASDITFRQLGIQTPDKLDINNPSLSTTTTTRNDPCLPTIDQQEVVDNAAPSCHPTDNTSARPPPKFAYQRTLFKNSRGTRLSFQSDSRTYNRRVSFDNSTLDAVDQQHVVLRQTSDGFERTRRSRAYLIPVNMDVAGALDGVKYALMDLVDESDEIIAVGIFSKATDPYASAQTKADELMRSVMEFHQGDKISMTVEVYSGKSAKSTLEEMVDIYEPSMVIVASHKRTKSSHEFSGTGIFRSALKRCMTPIIFVPTETYIRRASTGDILSSSSAAVQRCSLLPTAQQQQDESAQPQRGARRSASDPQVKLQQPIQRRHVRSVTSIRFIIRMMAMFKKKCKAIDE